MKKKGLVVAVILLFIGVAFAPSINANLPEENNELVDFKVEFYGLNGKQIIEFTKQGSINVEKLIEDIKNKLDSAKTKEETIVILKEAVISLNEQGLLPEDLSIDEAQRLVIGKYQNSKVTNILEQFCNINEENDECYNLFCFVVADSEKTGRGNIFSWVGQLWWVIFAILGFPLLSLPGLLIMLYGELKPFSIINRIVLIGETNLFSCGLYGIKHEIIPPMELALNGFTGIVITKEFSIDGPRSKAFYLGHALHIGPFESDPW